MTVYAKRYHKLLDFFFELAGYSTSKGQDRPSFKNVAAIARILDEIWQFLYMDFSEIVNENRQFSMCLYYALRNVSVYASVTRRDR